MQEGLFTTEVASEDLDSLPEPEQDLQVLYRFWGKDGTLLYVGITFRPNARWKAHSKDKPWWSEVVTITLEFHPDRESVEAAEREAIRSERPKYNVVHNRGAAPFPALVDMDQITAENAARFFRARATLKTSRSPLTPEQVTWVAEMLDMAAAMKAEEGQFRPSGEPKPLINISGDEVWICGRSNDYLYLPQLGFRITFGTGPDAAWTADDTERLRGADVIVIAIRLPGEWKVAAKIADALQGVARSVRVVRAAAGPDVYAHCLTGRRLDELVPVPMPMNWEKDGLIPWEQELSFSQLPGAPVHRHGPKRSQLPNTRRSAR